MSWDGYIQNLLSHGNIEDAAIFGFDPSPGLWASTAAYQGITAAELKCLSGNRDILQQNGLHVANTKCRMLKDELDADGSHVMQLKTRADAEGNSYVVCIGKTNKAYVIGKGKKDAAPGNVNKDVFNMTEYLRKNNS